MSLSKEFGFEGDFRFVKPLIYWDEKVSMFK
jgi:hypothetical protein